MKKNVNDTHNNHTTDQQFELLLYGEESSPITSAIESHLETCIECRSRFERHCSLSTVEEEVGLLLTGLDTLTLSHHRHDRIDSEVRLGQPSHPEMLGRLGRYEIERKIGSGGMGIVFKAIDTELHRIVAIKVLAPYLSCNGAARQRFGRESRAAAAVVHEHVVAIHNVESDGETPFLVMQYVSGESLQSRVQRRGPLSVEEILRIGIQTASGLAAAHAQGIVHRDVKPENILLEDGVDRVLLTDFGLARTVDDASLTHTGIIAGTPHYMSPEQANGDVSDHRTDLFSFGSVLYFMATGHSPFRAERAMGILHRICHSAHRPVRQLNAAVPTELSQVIDRLLEKNPSKRFASATAVQEALTRTLARIQGGTPARFAQARKWVGQYRYWVGAITLCAIACLLTIAIEYRGRLSVPSTLSKSESRTIHTTEATDSNSITASTIDPHGNESLDAKRDSTIAFLELIPNERMEFDRDLQRLTNQLDRLENAQQHRTESQIVDLWEEELRSIDRILLQVGRNN